MKTTKTNWKLSGVLLGLVVAGGVCAQPEPVSVLDWVNRSQDAAQRGDLADALDLARQATARDAGYAPGWKQLGAVQLRQQSYAAAAESLLVARSLDPRNASLLRDLSSAQWQIGQTNAAIESLRAACQLDPDNPAAWRDLASWHQAAGQTEAALELFQKTVELNPTDANAWRDLGWLLWSFNRRDEAIAAFDSAIRNGLTNRRELAIQLVAQLLEANQIDQALAALAQWEPEASLLDIALPLVAKGRLLAAKPLLLKAWEKEPAPLTGLYLAQAASRSGGAKQVPAYLAPFLQALTAKTDSDQIQIALKTLLDVAETLDSPEAVTTLLEKLGKPYRQDPRLLDLLEKSAERMRYRRQDAAAANFYRRLLERDPNRKAWIDAVELELKRTGTAAADKLLAFLQDKATSVVVRAGADGWRAQRKGRHAAAIAGFEKSLAAAPEQPRLRRLLFDSYLSVGRLADARAVAEWMEDQIAAGNDALRPAAAEMWTTLGEPDRAADWWQLLRLATPGVSYYAIEEAAAHYLACRPDDAIAVLEELIESAPSPQAYEALVEIHVALGRPEKAAAVAQAGLAVAPSPGLYRAYAENAEAAGLVAADTVAAARKLLESDPGHVQGALLAARQLQALGQSAEAVALQEGLLERNPDFFPALVALKNAASAERDFAQALRYSETIVADRPWDVESQLRHAIALSEAEHVRESLQLLRRTARRNEPQDLVPVLVYRYVVDCAYPGRNTVAQLDAHLRRLAAEGYRLATPEQLADSPAQAQAVVVLEDADLAVLQAVDAVLAELGGRAVYAAHRGILTRAIPGKPAPDDLRRLADSGRWLIATGGPENDRRQPVAKDGRRGNPFTHPIVKTDRAESDAAFRKRLETEFTASADALGDAPEKILIYPFGDYGQASLDSAREYRETYRDVVAGAFDQAIFYDDNGFLAPDHDPLRIPARVVPAAWSADRLAEHLRQENPAVRSQLELAKLLYWNRQHEEANYWFGRALAAGANPKEIAFNHGANALQQGDLPVALDQLRQARELDPESPKVERALANAVDRKRLTLEVGGRYWEDNEDRSYEQFSAQGGGYVQDYLRLGGFADANRWQTDGLGDERGTRVGAEARWHLFPQVWLEGQLWQLQFDRDLDDLVGGDLRLHLPNRWLGGYAELRYGRQEIETVEALRAEISADVLELATYSRLFDKVDLFANAQQIDRSDENETWLVFGRLVYRLQEWPYLGVGYLFRFGDSDSDPAEYWAPEELEQHQLYASWRGAWGPLGYSLSGQAGYSRELDVDWQFIWGGNARLDWTIARRLTLRLEGIYQESATYERTTVSAAALFRF
ncbi:MAG: tetratricopeptide repeat protein [Kiritimatiellia bacterium]